MRLRRGVPMLAAALTVASASPACAFEYVSNGGASSQATVAARYQATDPERWTIAESGGFTYAGGGTRNPTLAPTPAPNHRHRIHHR